MSPPPTSDQERDAIAQALSALGNDIERRWKIETTDWGAEVVAMSPSSSHGLNVFRIRREIEAQAPGVAGLTDTNVHDPVTGLLKVPDLCVIDEDSPDPSSPGPIDSRLLLLACEVVSPGNPGNDLVIKVDDYPRMGIPVYLLVDPRKATVTVYSDPRPGPDGIRYRSVVPHAFGETVQAGPWTLDTSRLTAYSDESST